MENKTKYGSYDDLELYQLINESWDITDRPYLLHAAYALSCLSEALESDDKDEDEKTEIWGKKIPERILKSIVKNVAETFNDAAHHGTKIDVWGRAYSVRKVNAYDHNRLEDIFDFPLQDGEYIITKDGVKKLADGEFFTFQKNKENLSVNKNFLRKVIMLAEDDENNGWDLLTDMEVAVYCWAKFYHKYQCNNEVLFVEKYKKHLYVNMSEVYMCLNEYSTSTKKLHGMYSFDYKKVMQWNEVNNQPSVIDKITDKEAEDYWYDVALKTSFKPIE